jgi:hypothetical protein
VFQTPAEPDLLGRYQNRSLGSLLTGEALLLEGWQETGLREPGVLGSILGSE